MNDKSVAEQYECEKQKAKARFTRKQKDKKITSNRLHNARKISRASAIRDLRLETITTLKMAEEIFDE